MTVVDDVKDRIDIVELVGETVKLRKSGRNYTGFCPFHPNTRTPAFVVFPETGTWRCFGACNEGGDAFRFLMKKEGWDFPEALQFLAQRAGVELTRRGPEAEAEPETQARLRQALEAAAAFYRHHLISTPGGQPVLDYLHQRGLRDETLETFGVGYSPEAWTTTRQHLLERGFAENELAEAGLTTEGRDGTPGDRFRHRIMFPIRDARGRMCGFGARAFDPQAQPKFLNSPQTSLFDKGRLLYGLDLARRSIRQKEQAVIVEGYLDVMALHQAGFTNAVSPMGTALTEDQLRLLKRSTRRMVLALDADAAGDQATLRGLDMARQSLDRQSELVFDPRGYIRFEGRLDAEIRVVSLPAGKDPDEIVLEDPAQWESLVQQARPVVEYVLDVLTATRPVDDPKVKAEIARQVRPLIEDVADPVEREAHLQLLARRLQIDERSLAGVRPPTGRPRRRTRPPAETSAPVVTGAVDPQGERFCLGLLLHNPELLYRVDRRFQELALDRLNSEDFTGTDRQVAFQAVRNSLQQDEEEPGQHWRSRLAPVLLEAAESLVETADALEIDPERLAAEAEAQSLRLRRRRLESQITQLRFQLQAAQEEEVEAGDIRRLAHDVQRLGTQKDQIDRALSAHRPSPTQEETSLRAGRAEEAAEANGGSEFREQTPR
ncbi:MAG TPA: DNA primase [Anaerolineales bacterium]|nr:DNA primase [Anaerolineales bacterium]